MPRRPGPVAPALAAAALAVGGRCVLVDRADAARLPLRASPVTSYRAPADAVPLILAADDFDSDQQPNLAARIADTGQPWRVHAGRFTASGGQVRGGGQSAESATVDATRSTVRVSVTLTFPSGPATGRAGFALHAADNGQTQLQLLYDAGSRRVELSRAPTNGQRAVLATRAVTVAEPGRPARVTVVTDGHTLTLTSERSGPQPLCTFTLSDTDRTSFGTNRDFGIVADGDAETRFDDFEVRR